MSVKHKAPDAIVDMADAHKVAKDMAKMYGIKSREQIAKLAKQLAYDAVAGDPGVAFRRGGAQQSPHRVVVAFVEQDETVTRATLAHCRSQSALWRLRLSQHGLLKAVKEVKA